MGMDYESGVAELEEWLPKQKHLPQFFDKLLLKRFVHSSQGDLEKAKKLIVLNYKMRNNYSHVFLKRDPCDEGTKNILKATDMLILPNATSDGYKVLFYRLADLDPSKFDFTEAIKVFFMFADVRFITEETDGLTIGEIPIFDMNGFSLRHMTKIVWSSLKIYMKFTQEAHPIRLKEIHIINCASFLDKVVNFVKPLIKSEVFKLIKFHLPESETLYKDVPKELLPKEYGGNAGTIADIKEPWIEILKNKRDYISNEKYWKTSCEITQSKENQIIKNNDINGNFRSLSID